jgi:hypothetical protein
MVHRVTGRTDFVIDIEAEDWESAVEKVANALFTGDLSKCEISFDEYEIYDVADTDEQWIEEEQFPYFEDGMYSDDTNFVDSDPFYEPDWE